MNPSSLPSKSTIDVDEAIRNQNDIALIVSKDLFSTKAKHSNSVFSPASLNTALTLAASGPPNDGSAGPKEILSFLRASSTDELNAVFSKIVPVVFADRSANGGPKISSINGVWVEKTLPVDLSLKDLFENFFKAVFDHVDFLHKAEEVRRELNEWAEVHTNGLIKDLLPDGSITDQTEYVYGNALYFKGQWEVPFDKSHTKDKEFHLLSGTSVSVPFMRSYEDQYIQGYDGFKVLMIPYRQGCDGGDGNDGSFSMYFYLPDKNDGLDDLVKTMASDSGFLDCHVPSRKVAVGDFRIPKFKIVDEVNNKDLGLDSTVLYHKACVEIDEEGAEAAAATFVVSIGGLYRKPPEEIDFVADHPFLFVIREDTIGTVLFVGQIVDPSDKSS